MKNLFLFAVLSLTTFGVKAQTKNGDSVIRNNIDVKQTVDSSAADNPQFIAIEKDAAFRWGVNKFYEYLYKNMKFSKDVSYSGKVTVQFTVGKSGKIIESGITKSDFLDVVNKEVLRAFMSSPFWTPGIQNGRAVVQSFTVTLDLNIKNGHIVNPSKQ